MPWYQTTFQSWCCKTWWLICELHFFSIIGYQEVSAHYNHSGASSNEAEIFLNTSGCCARGKESSGKFYLVTLFHSTHWLKLEDLGVQSSMLLKWVKTKYLWITLINIMNDWCADCGVGMGLGKKEANMIKWDDCFRSGFVQHSFSHYCTLPAPCQHTN